jgi:hypothetical protein
MKLEGTKRDEFEYEHHEINWTQGVGRPAGVYWFHGRSVIVAHESPGEARLVAAGAVLVATLRFDPDPLETTQRGRAVERLSPRSATRDFLVSGVN